MNLSSIKTALIFLSVITIRANAQTVLQQKAEEIFSDSTFGQAQTGICVHTPDGQTVVNINGGRMFTPASNMKLITTGAALHMLGEDFTFKTRIGYDGYIQDGVLQGNIHIIGGGDPTTGSKDSIAEPVKKLFDAWTKMISQAGIKSIDGHIIGDGRYFEGMAEEPSWLWSDVGTYYGSGTTGLMFYENMMSFSVSAGPETGAEINIVPSYPKVDWMEFIYECSTGKAGSGDRLYMYTSDLAPVAAIRGTFGVDRAAKRVDFSNKFPEYTCAHLFAAHLKGKGIGCSRGAADFKLKKEWMRDSKVSDCKELTIIGETESPSLERIVFETNHASNNLFAETLFRTIGKELRRNASYDSSYVAMNDALEKTGAGHCAGMCIQDGSGLSRQNLLSPEYICRFLDAMTESPCFNSYLASLPVPGGEGTLSYNMKKYPESLRSRIRVKSGSMNGVRCYSGYILPASPESGRGPLTFSIMVNCCTAPTWKVRPLLDRLMASLAEEW